MEETSKPRLRQADRTAILAEIALDELVGPDHPVRAVWDYVSALDLTPLLSLIRAVEGAPGRNATDPRILLALWMWATSDGVGTARAIDVLCREHSEYRWLAGGVTLNYHTLAGFRSSHAAILEEFLETHVSALLHHGLIDLSCVAQDGMRARASAGTGSFRRAGSIDECQRLVREQIAVLKRQADEPLDAVSRRQQAAKSRHARERLERLGAAKEALGAKQAERARQHPKEAKERGTAGKPGRASTTDPEARRMTMADGGTRPAFNVQCATTTDTGIIVGVAVTNHGSDNGLLGTMPDQIEKSYGRKPSQALADGGYGSKADVEAAHGRGIDVYTPLKNAEKELESGKDPHAPKTGDKAGMKALRARMGTPEAKELYKKRASTAEWVNAGMRQRGLRRFTVRGQAKALAVAALHALVHNLWQTARLLGVKKDGRGWAEILRAEVA